MPSDKTCCQRFSDWLGTPSCLIYTNYVMGAWGDWMWQFAVGLYLVYLAGGVLRLAAIFGFTAGIAVLLLGGIIGNWVDRNGRMKVVQISLFIQNLSVALCAVAVGLVLHYEEEVMVGWSGSLRYVCEGVIIALAVLAQLASVAYKIAIEKDWIVVIARGNKSQLANLNAITRAIDLTCKIMAPTVAGLIMTYGSLFIAAIVIASWNVFSVFVEYAILRRVYKMVPRLAVKEDIPEDKELQEVKDQDQPMMSDPEKGAPVDVEEKSLPATEGGSTDKESGDTQKDEGQTCLQLMFEPFITLAKGWKTYAKQRVVFAGVSLAFLYMTVLGFDSITTGYIYAQGISEALVGLSMALAGLTGIIGTIAFTRLRRSLGLERTGLIAFNAEIICLSLTVASIWAPGSPFDPFFNAQPVNCSAVGGSTIDPSSAAMPNASSSVARYTRDVSALYMSEESMLQPAAPFLYHELTMLHSVPSLDGARNRRSVQGEGEGEGELVAGAQTGDPGAGRQCHANKYVYNEGTNVSIILFLLGIIISRVGLWMADLVVTQLLQENVVEKERGSVNGVQNSLNMLMDMIKFILVIFVPHIETFGFLILLSFLFICMAACFFAYHSWRERGHLFHFDRFKKVLCITRFVPPVVEETAEGRGGQEGSQNGGQRSQDGGHEGGQDGGQRGQNGDQGSQDGSLDGGQDRAQGSQEGLAGGGQRGQWSTQGDPPQTKEDGPEAGAEMQPLAQGLKPGDAVKV